MLEQPRNLQNLGISLLAAFGIALFAQLRIELPLNEAGIPISGQSFAVLLVGFLLGRKWGLAAILIYLALGFIGLPDYTLAGRYVDGSTVNGLCTLLRQ